MPNLGSWWCASFAMLLLSLCSAPLPAQQPADPLLAALAAMPAAAPLGSGTRIVVLDDTGKPAPDAIVVFVARPWQSEAMQQWHQLLRQHPGDLIAAVATLARQGTRHALDAQAETRVPDDLGFVLAARGTTFALVRPLAAAKPRRVLRLQSPREALVVVTAADGTPASNVDVGVREHDQLLLRARTGQDGRCTLRAIGDDLPDVELLVGCKLPRRAAWPANAQPIPFVLPATTSLTAKLVGERCPGADVQWRLHAADAGPTAIFEPATSDAAQAHWPHVERGALVRVIASVGAIETPPVEVQLDAAQQIDVPRAAKQRLCAFRLVDEHGQPQRWRSLSIAQKDDKGRLAMEMATSNGEGWVETRIGPQLGDTVRMTLGVNEGEFGTPLLDHADVQVTETLAGRRVLDDVRLARLPIAVKLQLKRPDGQPAAGVRLSTFHIAVQHTTTDANGEATLRLLPEPPEKIGLGLPPGWYATSEPFSRLDVALPQDDKRSFVVQPAARVCVGVRGLPAVTPVGALRAEFRLASEAEEGKDLSSLESLFSPLRSLPLPTEDTEWLVPQGRWHFRVSTSEGTVLEIPDVECTAGEPLYDPRFLDFDWRSFTCLAQIRIEDANGRLLPAAKLEAVYDKATHVIQCPNGRATLLLPKQGARLHVVAEDPRLLPIDLGVVTGDRTVRVGAGPRLRWRPAQMPELRPGHRLLLMAGADHAGVSIENADGTTLQLPAPGPVHLMLSVYRDGAGQVLAGSAHIVDVPAAGAEFEFPLTDALRKRIEAESARR